MMQNHRFKSGNRFQCMHGASCVKYGCNYAHPSSRPKDCPNAGLCRLYGCKLHHPRSNKEVACRFGSSCDKPLCPFAHPEGGDVASPTRFCKPCMHGAFCVKFGCGYSHPAERRQECKLGVTCNDNSCRKLHPRPHPRKAPVSKFLVGQQVQAQYSVDSAWRFANVYSVRSSSLTLQFVGWDDTIDIPLERIRHTPERKVVRNIDIPPGFSSVISRGAAVASLPSPKSVIYKAIKPQSEQLMQLERLKQAAITQENFLLAAKLKQQMDKVTELELKKAAAVRGEDFLLAMDIKKQIVELLTTQSPSTSIRRETETKMEWGAPCNVNKHFSLFEESVACIRVN